MAASTRRILNLVFALSFFVIHFAGCGGGDGVELATVTGVVTLDGAPLSDASVSFHPESGRGSFGKTDSDGRYNLRYMKEMGATIGSHKVTITSKVWAPGSRKLAPGQSAKSAAEAAAGNSRPELLPEKYRERESSILTANVVAGQNEFDFVLESE